MSDSQARLLASALAMVVQMSVGVGVLIVGATLFVVAEYIRSQKP